LNLQETREAQTIHIALHDPLVGHSSTAQTSDRIRPTQADDRLEANSNTDSLKTCVGRTAGWQDSSLQRRQTACAANHRCNCKQQTVGPAATCMTDSIRHVGLDGRNCYCIDASCAEFVNTRSETDLQQIAELQRNSLQRTTGRANSSKFCSDSLLHSKQQQQGSAAVGRTVGNKLTENAAACRHISPQQAGSDNKAHVTLAEKVAHLCSRDFLIDN